VTALDADQAELARLAWRRGGRGRHPAGLDYGDLFAYALATATGEPQPYKSDGIARTDITSR
jgi:ribonuclease VapC